MIIIPQGPPLLLMNFGGACAHAQVHDGIFAPHGREPLPLLPSNLGSGGIPYPDHPHWSGGNQKFPDQWGCLGFLPSCWVWMVWTTKTHQCRTGLMGLDDKEVMMTSEGGILLQEEYLQSSYDHPRFCQDWLGRPGCSSGRPLQHHSPNIPLQRMTQTSKGPLVGEIGPMRWRATSYCVGPDHTWIWTVGVQHPLRHHAVPNKVSKEKTH